MSPALEAVLQGNYMYNEHLDGYTWELLEECTRIRSSIPCNSVNSLITKETWQTKWKRAREDTSLSKLGLHFGHYKAGADSDLIAHFHAMKTSLALKHGIALKRWSRGLSVMLEKMFGCKLVGKLQAILLMEADLNFANKQVYGVEMLNNVRKYGFMPEEIYSEKNRIAEDGSLAKVLFYDMVGQSRIAAGLASVDAGNCYNSIAHAIALMTFQAFGVNKESVQAMLVAIEDMFFFLRTVFGDSKNSVGTKIRIKTQGLCQGNGTAPSGWAITSITIPGAHKRKGHGAKIVCSISK